MNLAPKHARLARISRARDTDCSSVTSSSTLDESRHWIEHPQEVSTSKQHSIKYGVGNEESEEEDPQVDHEQTDNGKNFSGIQVPEGAPADLVCEECERRFAVGYCEDCEEALCAPCLAIMHIPNASGQAHMHLTQGGIRILRAGDTSSVVRDDNEPIPAHEIDEEEMATRRNLSLPSSFDAPTMDFTSISAPRNASTPLHTKGQLVVFKASLADSLPDDLADDDDGIEERSSLEISRPRELYGEVMSVPMARHGEWGHAGRRTQGHRLLVRVRILGRASRGFSEPFVEEWLCQKHRRDGPREPVKISGGSGADPLAREVGAAKVKDRRREEIRSMLKLPDKELLVEPPSGDMGFSSKGRGQGSGQPARSHGHKRPKNTYESFREENPRVVLVVEHELFTIEQRREEVRKSRCSLLEACQKSTQRRQKISSLRMALERWQEIVANIRNARWEWASQLLQKRTRGALVRLRLQREREAKYRTMREASRRLHKQFRYLDTEELRKKKGPGVTVNGRVFLQTKADLNRLEALRRLMAEKAYRLLCKGVYHVKIGAFKHWLHHTEMDRRNNETYLFTVARNASLAGDETGEEVSCKTEEVSCKTECQHPSHGIKLPPLLQVHSGRLKANKKDQAKAVAVATLARKMAGPTPFCSWLVPGSVLMSSYLDAEAKNRLRDFRQPLYPDAASQIMLAGVGTFVSLSSEGSIRQYEEDQELQPFDQAFGVRHKVIDAATKVRMGEAKHQFMMLRQEEKNIEMLRFVEDYDQEERRKALEDIVGRMSVARSAYASAKRTTDLFPKELTIVWDPLLEDKASDVNDVVELAVRLEDRLRAGEKLCLWSPRGHGRVGLVGAVLLGRLYGCTAADALLRVQVCHDARETLKGFPQISCPQTIAQVQCVHEVLLQMSSMYTELTMRADLPASTRGVKVRESVRGEGPPYLQKSIRVYDETQRELYKRKKEHHRQLENVQGDYQLELLPPPSTTTTIEKSPTTIASKKKLQQSGGSQSPRPLLGNGLHSHGSSDRARAVIAVPFPTMRSLRLA